MKKYQYGLIGVGNMGYAILKGLLYKVPATEIIFSARNRENMERIHACTGVSFAQDNEQCAENAKYIILAVKPQQLDSVIAQIRDVVSREHIIVSIAPGITIASMREKFGRPVRVVRAMPNTPVLVGEGMTGVCYDSVPFSVEEQEFISAVFESFGKMAIVEEQQMDAVVCVSGSSPAYVYLLIESLADSGVKYGLTRKDAYKMAAQTVLGSAKMVLETGLHPGELKDQVCSPAGTTIAGVSALEEFGFRNAILKAGDACYEACIRIKGGI